MILIYESKGKSRVSAFQFHTVNEFVSVTSEAAVVSEEQVSTSVASAEYAVICFSCIVKADDTALEASLCKAVFKAAFPENYAVKIC